MSIPVTRNFWWMFTELYTDCAGRTSAHVDLAAWKTGGDGACDHGVLQVEPELSTKASSVLNVI